MIEEEREDDNIIDPSQRSPPSSSSAVSAKTAPMNKNIDESRRSKRKQTDSSHVSKRRVEFSGKKTRQQRTPDDDMPLRRREQPSTPVTSVIPSYSDEQPGPSSKSKLRSFEESDNEEEAEHDSANNLKDLSKSAYVVSPIEDPFNNKSLIEQFIDEYIESANIEKPDNPEIIRSVQDVLASKVKLQKIPVKKQMFTQFLYKKPVRLVIVTNLYGAFVNNQDAFNERPKLFDVACLTPKHKVTMLSASVNHWWHDVSKQTMLSFINSKLLNDIKTQASGSHFAEAVVKFKITDVRQALINMKEKLVSATKLTQEGLMPGVFNLKVHNTNSLPSKIVVPLLQFEGVRCRPVSWKKLLLKSTFVHAVAIISVGGFKVTRSGISIDMDLDSMAYIPVPDKLQRKPLTFRELAVPTRLSSSWLLPAKDSSDEDEDNVSVKASQRHSNASYNLDDI